MSREDFFFSYLYSEIKTKPKNHGLREVGKTPPPPYLSNFMFIKDNTFCVSIGLDYVKDRWAFQKEDGSEHKEVVTMCCAIKPITSWLLEETVSITRLEFLCFFLTIFLLLFMKNQPSSFL